MRAAVTDLNVDRLVAGRVSLGGPVGSTSRKLDHGNGAGAYESSNFASKRGLVIFGL